jgi:ketosteroid isomerase-like protein
MGKSAAAGDPATVDTIKQLEQDIGNAMVAGDIDKLNQFYADDWATVGSDGKTYNKESLLDDFKSGEHKLLSFESGPMDVQVFGNVAVAQGSVSEKRTQYGKNVSGVFVFNDLLKKRAGKWVVVRRAGARAESGN